MSNPPFNCVIPGCTETRVYAHYMKHLMDHKGSEFPSSLGLSTGTRGSLLYLKPKINGKPSMFEYRGCLGCGKMFQKMALIQKHNDTCTKREQHKEICKKYLESTDAKVVSTTEVYTLKKEIQELKEKLITKTSLTPASIDKKALDQALDMEDAFFTWIKDEYENNFHHFVNKMIKLKVEHENIFKKMISDLDLKEAQFPSEPLDEA